MKRLFLSLFLACVFSIQLSQQQITFNPQHQTTGPFGTATGTTFNFGGDYFNTLPTSITVSRQSKGLTSISFGYMQLIGEDLRTGGTPSGTTTRVDYPGRIIKAQVCTGEHAGSTVITGLRFDNLLGGSNYFHINNCRVSTSKCEDATPSIPGYYLQYVSGSYGTYLNELTLNWVSNFEQEQACWDDPNCNQELNFCPSNDCCFIQTWQGGRWERMESCA